MQGVKQMYTFLSFFPLASLQSVRLKAAGNEKENEVDRSHLMWSLSEGTAVTAVAMHAQRLVCTMTTHKQVSLNLRVGVRWRILPLKRQFVFFLATVASVLVLRGSSRL